MSEKFVQQSGSWLFLLQDVFLQVNNEVARGLRALKHIAGVQTVG